RGQGGNSDGKAVEVYRRNGLWKARGPGGDDSQRAWTGDKAQSGEIREAALRSVRPCSGSEEAQPEFVHLGCAEGLGIAHHKLLGASGSSRRKSRNTGGG